MALTALLVLVLGAAPVRVDPAAQAALAAAFSVPEAQVLEARRFTFAEPGRFPSFVVGRYRETPNSPWTVPGLGRYHACPAGTCVTPLSLGPAVSRIAAYGLVDLDAARSEVSLPSEPAGPLAAPAIVGWPAVVLLVEREAGERRLSDLLVVSLRENTPEVLLSYPAEQRAPDATRKEMQGPSPRPSTAPLGHRVEAVRFEHLNDAWSLSLIERAIGSRWSACPAPKAYEVGFRLGKTVPRRFEETSRPPKPGTCP